ncbi:MAG: hypothetical protein ABIQ09_09040 [Jatrophihabitantaceae bacterium]
MSIATDVRAYADMALEQGKSALNQAGAVVNNANKRLTADAPKSVLAALGVADMVAETLGKRAEELSKRAETVGKRVESLPAEAVGNVAKAQETGKALLSRTQDDALARITELRDLLDTGVGSVKALPTLSVVAASTTTVYLSNAKQAFEKLTARGEARLAELRSDPRVTRLMGDLDEASAAVQARIAPVLGSMRSEVVPYLDSAFDAISDADLDEPVVTSQAGRKTAGRRSAAGRATASATRKSTASTRSTTGGSAKSATSSADKTVAAARKAPATKAAAARKAPATKTAAARKAPATKTAAARKAPAKKA